jgi:tRNA threonylcarbamoyl adenosine modification protein YeaZ
MNFLSIDCSTDLGSLFLNVENKSFIKLLQNSKSNNDSLMKQISTFFQENGKKVEDIHHIFVNQGPGNFSGLRTSLAIAKGISLSKNLNLFGYNTFIWSCSKFLNKNDNIYSFIEFRKKFFLQKFDKNLNIISKIEEIKKETIISNFKDKFKVIPKNMVNVFDKEILKLNNLSIVDLDHKNLEFLKIKGLLDEDLIKPLYLS